MNRLSTSKSPYLRQHAHNPVDWYPWGDEALGKARNEDKWIFLSIGYSSCHWCHVMERESFEDPAVADFLNEHFVSIKVDREERPDIDAIYMEAVQIISGHGGWPLNIWLTPDLVPIYGGTYFPPSDMHQRPGFVTVAQRLLEIRTQDPEMVRDRVEKIRHALQHDLYDNLPEAAVTQATIHSAVIDYRNRFDAEFGGFSSAPKFPQAMGLRFLLQTDDTVAHQMAIQTIKRIVRGGIWDALGGGLHRYSTDHKWLVPHFEKMLYDQSTMLEALCTVQSKYPEPLFAWAISDMITFLERDLKHPMGGYISALDADTNGIEGLTYIWSDTELAEALSPHEMDIARFYYGIKPGGNWEGSHILVRERPIATVASDLGMSIDEMYEQVSSIREKLLALRNQRPQPAIDDKVITAWNAMLLSAFVDASLLTGDPHILKMASELGNFLSGAMYDGGVFRVCYQGEWEQAGFLDDVAFLAQAFFKLYGINADQQWLNRGIELVEIIRVQYFDHATDGFWFSGSEHHQPLGKTREVFDNATPSATSGAIGAFLAAYQLTGDRNYDMIAQRALRRLTTVMADHGTAFGSALQHANAIVKGRFELVLVGPEPEPFIDVWRAFDSGNITILVNRDGNGAGPLLTGRPFEADKTSAWLCREGACELPVYNTEALRTILKKYLHQESV
jgi:uncharacterized protein YyaL (SSP411 family)